MNTRKELTMTHMVIDRRKAKNQFESGLLRIHEETRRVQAECDSEWKKADSSLWDTDWGLLPHDERVAKRLVAMGRDEESAIRYTIGLLHDSGKTASQYRMHRLRRRLTRDEKKIMKGHEKESGRRVKRLQRMVRKEDRPFWDYVYPPVRHHHDPWLIIYSALRVIGWDTMLADIFEGCQEERAYRRTKDASNAVALRVVRREIREKVPFIARVLFRREIIASYNRLLESLITRA